MAAIDQRFDRVDSALGDIRQDMRGDISRLQDRLIQIGFGLVAAQFAFTTAVVIPVA